MLDLDFILRRQAERQAQVGIARAHPLGGLSRGADLHREMNTLIKPPKTRDALRQEIQRKTFRAGDAHMAALQALQLGDFQHHLLGLQLGFARIGRQTNARFAEHHAARLTLEQHGIQLALQLADLPTDRRRRHIEPNRGLAD